MPSFHARMRPFRFTISIAICAMAVTSAIASEPAKMAKIQDDGLPAGDGAAFRQRMMSWSTSAPAPVTQPLPAPSRTVDLPRLSSGFGTRHDPLRGTPARHAGVDIPAPLGTPIFASADGAIRFAGRAGGYGNMIEIEHGNGIRTRYAHLARILIGERAMVKRGQVIALMGSTGRSTGSHLHFEMRANGAPIDPLSHLERETDAPPRRAAAAPSEPTLSSFARARAAAKESDTLPAGGR